MHSHGLRRDLHVDESVTDLQPAQATKGGGGGAHAYKGSAGCSACAARFHTPFSLITSIR